MSSPNSPSPSSSGFSESPLPRRPDLVLILTDDQRADTLWAMPEVRLLLARHGVTFTNFFVTTSDCCPSRASILSGQYSRHTGVFDNSPPNGGAPAFHDQSTLATWLKAAGCTTGLEGKYLNAYHLLGQTYIPPGWDDWHVLANKGILTRYYNYVLNENGRLVSHGRRPADYSTTYLANRAIAFIRTAKGPFFLYYAPIAPHNPAIPAPQDAHRFDNLRPYRPPRSTNSMSPTSPGAPCIRGCRCT
jgi:N-acetylglucosamine-6-sulfatase